MGDFQYLGEFDLESEFESGRATREPGELFSETDEMDLASRLLEIDNPQELDQFLGRLLQQAGRTLGRPIGSDTGRALHGLLKRAAQKSIPFLAAGPGGSPFDRQQGEPLETAERVFGLELEGLSAEDQEFEVARRFVRFAGKAAQGAAAGRGSPPARARRGFHLAARRLAPGLLRPPRQQAGGPSVYVRGGHWIRQGRNIVVINCGPPAGGGQAPEPAAQGDEPGPGTGDGAGNLGDEEF